MKTKENSFEMNLSLSYAQTNLCAFTLISSIRRGRGEASSSVVPHHHSRVIVIGKVLRPIFRSFYVEILKLKS